MKYQVAEGIVLESLCGTDLLIATLEARKSCPYLMRLNEASAYIWRHLLMGTPVDELSAAAARDFEIAPQEADETIREFLTGLAQQNYVTLED